MADVASGTARGVIGRQPVTNKAFIRVFIRRRQGHPAALQYRSQGADVVGVYRIRSASFDSALWPSQYGRQLTVTGSSACLQLYCDLSYMVITRRKYPVALLCLYSSRHVYRK